MIVKTLQGLGMLDVSVVLWIQGFSGFNGVMIQRRAGSPKGTKTRLRSNYSYYRILIVEDAQPIVYERKQR